MDTEERETKGRITIIQSVVYESGTDEPKQFQLSYDYAKLSGDEQVYERKTKCDDLQGLDFGWAGPKPESFILVNLEGTQPRQTQPSQKEIEVLQNKVLILSQLNRETNDRVPIFRINPGEHVGPIRLMVDQEYYIEPAPTDDLVRFQLIAFPQ